MRFTKVKLLHLPTSFAQDWAEKGLPVEEGETGWKQTDCRQFMKRPRRISFSLRLDKPDSLVANQTHPRGTKARFPAAGPKSRHLCRIL